MGHARSLPGSLLQPQALLILACAIGCSAQRSRSGEDRGGPASSGSGGAEPVGPGSGGTANPSAGGTPSAGTPSAGTPSAGTSSAGTPSGGGTAGIAPAGSGGSVGVTGPIECRVAGDGRTTLVIVNGCSQTLTYAGSDAVGGSVPSGGHVCIDVGSDVEPLSAKRYWGYVGEDPGAEHHTLAELTLNTDFNDFDWYNISHVDAHNLPLQIVPAGYADCPTLTCADSLLAGCPEPGRWYGSDGTLLACVSPERDDPESPVALWFEQCDDAYAWSGDDQRGDDPSPMRGVCAGEDYDVVFCPAP